VIYEPDPPPSLPNYLARGMPKQDADTLHDIREYVDGERERVEREIQRMTSDPDAPLRPVQDGPRVCLSSLEEVLRYLDRHDADIPSGLEVFVTSPRE
jgi:hypothetical protein